MEVLYLTFPRGLAYPPQVHNDGSGRNFQLPNLLRRPVWLRINKLLAKLFGGLSSLEVYRAAHSCEKKHNTKHSFNRARMLETDKRTSKKVTIISA